MLQDISLPGYKVKWVCKKCGANHFYLPSTGQCQRCEFPRLAEVRLADEVRWVCRACKKNHRSRPKSGECEQCDFTQFDRVVLEKK